MTAEAPTPRESQDPLLDGVEGEGKPRDILAEARALLLAAHGLNNQAKATRLSSVKKRGFQAEAAGYLAQADQLIAEQYGLTVGNPDDHLTFVSQRARLRKEALEQQGATTRTSYEIGRKAFTSAKREQQSTEPAPDARMRAAEGSLRSPWNQD